MSDSTDAMRDCREIGSEPGSEWRRHPSRSPPDWRVHPKSFGQSQYRRVQSSWWNRIADVGEAGCELSRRRSGSQNRAGRWALYQPAAIVDWRRSGRIEGMTYLRPNLSHKSQE